MKKKILFVIPSFEHGGTNKTLENYLPFLTAYDVSIFSLDGSKRKGYYFELFRPYLLPLFALNFIVKVNFFTRKVFVILFHCMPKLKDVMDKKEIEYIQKKYHFDTIIAFQEGGATTYVSRSTCCRKIAWLHSFYTPLKDKSQYNEFLSSYRQFDDIVCVSEKLKEYFVCLFPSLAKQSVQIYNPLNSDKIKKLSSEIEGNAFPKFDGFKILSIGRLDKVKNFHVIPSIISKIKQKGCCHFRWYIIGADFSDDYLQMLINLIKSYHVERELVLLGQKDNPYSYIKQADLVACTSCSESFSYVINEGKILHTPVISNNFPVAEEVLSSECGWIASLDEMPDILFDIINNVDNVYSKVKESISTYSYQNEKIIEQVCQIL